MVFYRLFSGRPGVGERPISGLDHGDRDEGLRREVVVLRDRGSGDSRDQDSTRSRLATSSKSRYSDWSQRPHSFGDNRIEFVSTLVFVLQAQILVYCFSMIFKMNYLYFLRLCWFLSLNNY